MYFYCHLKFVFSSFKSHLCEVTRAGKNIHHALLLHQRTTARKTYLFLTDALACLNLFIAQALLFVIVFPYYSFLSVCVFVAFRLFYSFLDIYAFLLFSTVCLPLFTMKPFKTLEIAIVGLLYHKNSTYLLLMCCDVQ